MQILCIFQIIGIVLCVLVYKTTLKHLLQVYTLWSFRSFLHFKLFAIFVDYYPAVITIPADLGHVLLEAVSLDYTLDELTMHFAGTQA